MLKLRMTIAVALLALCCVSCRKAPTPADLVMERTSGTSGGLAPLAANVIKIDPPAAPEPQVTTATVEPTEAVINVSHPAVYRNWLMLVAIILVLFLLSVVLFHGMGRRLRKKSFRAHAPTQHADIWASHKPPEFLDP